MNFNGFCNFEEFIKNCGFCAGCSTIPGAPYGCSDIPGGFQDLNPDLFIIIAEILGNVVAGNLPFNVQSAIGNWLLLVGQVIITYNSQQQYFEGGPDRYYDIRNKNVSNPFCPTQSKDTETSSDTTASGNVINDKEVWELKKCIGMLINEVEQLKKQIKNIHENK